jgi:hypothetical protein
MGMATAKQTQAARSKVKKAQPGASGKKTIAQRAASGKKTIVQRAASGKKTVEHLPAKTKTALGKRGAAVTQRKRTGGTAPKTRTELYEIAKRRDLPGRSKMGRDELARSLGVS